MELQHCAGSLPADPAREDPEGAEIDLERATWDAAYRSKVLALLRRARGAETPPSDDAAPTPKRDDDQH